MRHLIKSGVVLTLILVLPGCGGKEREPSPADNTKDRKVILTHWVDNIVVPSYKTFHQHFEVMADHANAFSVSPDEASLLALRDAWVQAYRAWQKVELFEFGPADKYTLRNFFNIYPADVSGITANIADPAVNLDLPASYSRQGFPALDYLLNGIGQTDADILAAYTTDANAGQRTAYLTRLTERMSTLLAQVIQEWNGPYRDTFINQTGLDIGSSFGLVVNAYVLYYERYVRTGKIGIPSGAAIGSSGVPYPERIEAYYHSPISRDLATMAHQAARDFFNGVDPETGQEGPSLGSYLDALGSKDAASGKTLSEIINEQFSVVSSELGDLLPDLSGQIAVNNEEMVETYSAMQKLVRLLKVDMTSAMSITITYTDNDGD